MSIDDNIWYAVNQTRIITEPRQTLETFGVTRIRYYILSEVMDRANEVKINEGLIISEKPSIITPGHFAQQLLDGFGAEAREYADWLTQHGEFIQILQYGLQIRKEEIREETVSGSLGEVIGRVLDVAGDCRDLSTVIEGVENMWEVSLMKFMQHFIERSAGRNIHEIQSHEEMLLKDAAMKTSKEIEEEFYEARGYKRKILDLGNKLQDLGIFHKYEDRFYALLRECD